MGSAQGRPPAPPRRLRRDARRNCSATSAAGPAASVERFFHPAQLPTDALEAIDSLRQTARTSSNLELLKVCWLNRIVHGPDPLREKLTLFWHGHFATSNKKVESVALMDRQNETLRSHAIGECAPLLEAIIADPAMLVWLDGGTSRKDKPNENFAREFLELFTLGAGNYTERDVREAARAFTGWTQQDSRRGFRETPSFTRDPTQVDDGPKTFLGQTGRWGPADIVRIVLDRPEAATFLARKLYRFFVSEAGPPAPELIEPLAAEIKSHHFAVAPVVEIILRSQHFYSPQAYRSRIKSPVEHTAGLVRMLEIPRPALNPLALSAACDLQGQELFAPPSVEGWVGGQAWINSATLLERTNWSSDVIWGRAENGLSPFDPLEWAARYKIDNGRMRKRWSILCSRMTLPRNRGASRFSPHVKRAPRVCAKRFSSSPIALSFNWLDQEKSMHHTRRELIRLGLGSSTLLACGQAVPVFLARSAAAVADEKQAASSGRILVVVQLDGGNDGLNTVVPFRDDEYRKQRPTIQVPAADVRKIDDHVGLHPALESFSKLLERQRLAIVQSVGYPNPNRSHFESMAIWQTARLEAIKAAPGWLARAIDVRPAPQGDAPGLHVHDAMPLPQSLAGGRHVIPSLDRLEQFRRRLGVPGDAGPAAQIEALDQLARQDSGATGSLLQFVERCSLITYASSATTREARPGSGIWRIKLPRLL